MNRYNPDIHHRRSIRLKGYDYSQEGLYFVTICVQNKECIFGEIVENEIYLNDTGRIIEKEWLNLKNKYQNIDLHEFVVMPNHFHGIIQIIDDIVGAGFARPVNEIENTNNVDEIYGNVNDINDVAGTGRANPAPTKDEKRPYIPTLGNIIAFFKYQTTKIINLQTKLWQRNYHEHIIRNEDAYLKISEYVKFNPALWNEDILNPINENINKEKYGY